MTLSLPVIQWKFKLALDSRTPDIVTEMKMHFHLLIICNRSGWIGLVWIKINYIRNTNKTESNTFSCYNYFCWIDGSVEAKIAQQTKCTLFPWRITISVNIYLHAKPAWCIARKPAVNCIMIAQISVSGKYGPFGVRCKLLLWLKRGKKTLEIVSHAAHNWKNHAWFDTHLNGLASPWNGSW